MGFQSISPKCLNGTRQFAWDGRYHSPLSPVPVRQSLGRRNGTEGGEACPELMLPALAQGTNNKN